MPHCAAEPGKRGLLLPDSVQKPSLSSGPGKSDMVLGSSCEAESAEEWGERDELETKRAKAAAGNWRSKVRILCRHRKHREACQRQARQPDVSQ